MLNTEGSMRYDVGGRNHTVYESTLRTIAALRLNGKCSMRNFQCSMFCGPLTVDCGLYTCPQAAIDASSLCSTIASFWPSCFITFTCEAMASDIVG